MVHVPSAAEFVLRLVVAALDITVLSIVIYCSARVDVHFILSYIAVCRLPAARLPRSWHPPRSAR